MRILNGCGLDKWSDVRGIFSFFNLSTKMYHVGQKITWLTIINGSIVKVVGEITQILGEWMWVKGKTLCKNIEVTDRITVYDNTISS